MLLRLSSICDPNLLALNPALGQVWGVKLPILLLISVLLSRPRFSRLACSCNLPGRRMWLLGELY
jgi:hypothetical protein